MMSIDIPHDFQESLATDISSFKGVEMIEKDQIVSVKSRVVNGFIN